MLVPKTLGDLAVEPFEWIGERWMLVSAGRPGDWNGMTASWGGFGVLWNRNVAFAFVRPTRHTYAFMEKNEVFSLSFFPERYRKALQVFGTISGRDRDKAAEAGVTPCAVEADGLKSIGFEEADTVVVCKRLYSQDLDPARFFDPTIDSLYKDDYHRMYIGEIAGVLGR